MLRDNQLQVFWLARMDYQKNKGVRTHYHQDFYQLLYVINGHGFIDLKEEKNNLLENHVYLIHKGQKHSFYFTKRSSTIDIKFTVLDVELEKLVKCQADAFPFKIDNDEKIKDLFKLSLSNLERDKIDPLVSYQADILFKEILVSILRDSENKESLLPTSFSEVKNTNGIDSPIRNFLLNNLHREISLKEISETFNYHPNYIIDLFKRRYNITPIKYLQLLRILKSKEYLEFRDFSIKEIAEKIGFSTPYFSRLFYNIEGMTPSEYRNKTRTVIGKSIVLEETFFESLKIQPDMINMKFNQKD